MCEIENVTKLMKIYVDQVIHKRTVTIHCHNDAKY